MTNTSDVIALNEAQKSARDTTVRTIKPIADPVDFMKLVRQSMDEREAVYKALAK